MKEYVPIPHSGDEEPEIPPNIIYRWGIIGFGLTIIPAIVGLIQDKVVITAGSKWGLGLQSYESPGDFLSILRIFMVAIGSTCAGCAISMRPKLPMAWLLGAITFASSACGMPIEWDSFRLFFRVMSFVFLGFSVYFYLSPKVRFVLVSLWLAWHFAGILSAVTNPPPSPWLSQQAWIRVFRPYLHFIYLNNAYQFYSPDPGPASELWSCIEYTPDDPSVHPVPTPEGDPGYFRWIKYPKRPEFYRDPLGQTYLRVLALTEQASQLGQQNSTTEWEQSLATSRRNQVGGLFPMENIPRTPQYQAPATTFHNLLVPSYIEHIAFTNQVPGFTIKSIKLYRVKHMLPNFDEFVKDVHGNYVSPYDPSTYFPYFYGEFVPISYENDPNHEVHYHLKDAEDPMLYWLLPIVLKSNSRLNGLTMDQNQWNKNASVSQLEKNSKGDDNKNISSSEARDILSQLKSNDKDSSARFREIYHRYFTDYVSKHAKFDHLRGSNLP